MSLDSKLTEVPWIMLEEKPTYHTSALAFDISYLVSSMLKQHARAFSVVPFIMLIFCTYRNLHSFGLLFIISLLRFTLKFFSWYLCTFSVVFVDNCLSFSIAPWDIRSTAFPILIESFFGKIFHGLRYILPYIASVTFEALKKEESFPGGLIRYGDYKYLKKFVRALCLVDTERLHTTN